MTLTLCLIWGAFIVCVAWKHFAVRGGVESRNALLRGTTSEKRKSGLSLGHGCLKQSQSPAEPSRSSARPSRSNPFKPTPGELSQRVHSKAGRSAVLKLKYATDIFV